MPKKPLLALIDPDRFSARMSLIITAIIPLLALGLTQLKSEKSSKKRQPVASASSNSGADQRLIEFCTQNVKPNRAFVLFQHGTCVVIENQSDAASIRAKAISTLREVGVPGARFVCTPVDSNDIIVSYTEPVFHLRFAEDMERHRKDIENDFRRFLTEEELADISPHWEPPFHAKVGLRSRARLLKDAANPVVSSIVAPKGTEKTRMEQTASVSF